MNFPSFEILHDAVVRAMAVGDENVAVGRRDDARPATLKWQLVVAGDAGFAERHQQLLRPG